MEKLKTFLHKLFWLDKFEGKSKILNFGAKFFMYCYIILIPLNLLLNIISLDLENIIFGCFLFIIYPIMYRIVMGFQRLIHGI
ncbi:MULTISPECIES: hypothetical protein [Clostridium]|uniref:Uncharacterized protein n=1 Tax=Clostridium botulinum TaxID=1491 RepID=A0A6B4JK49_CLOBO|nr:MULTISPECIES: hypothetical protein [Clostridium]EES47969.1 hypothetical protein CLO_0990 [Clostridium botulinum E1 str. 'BoNT E Beluga']MBN1036175.1 hypothetical protein [Clostridium botulinum]MBY6760158.1 hypothetical protein [Clostridium botulinum]MBY6919067.1 hypothetical protein [Clostridium botulinum]MCR1132210.1 hypothetical protein [Clostridium botulinum]